MITGREGEGADYVLSPLERVRVQTMCDHRWRGCGLYVISGGEGEGANYV